MHSIKVANKQQSVQVDVKVRRPKWQEYIHY